MVRESLTREEINANSKEFVYKLRVAGVPNEAIHNLTQTDLFVAPASTQFHGVYVGGLVDHSLGVCDWLVKLNSIVPNPFPLESCYRVALLHDLCKVNVYKKSTRNKKIDGRWQEVQGWEFKEDYPLGHGEKSLDMILDLGIVLERYEKLAIRHHMGAYELTGMPLKAYQSAVSYTPLVLLLHTADMMETLYGRVEKDETVKQDAESNAPNSERPQY